MANLLFHAVCTTGLVALMFGAAGAAALESPAVTRSSVSDLNLPRGFLECVADRAIIDDYQIRHHRVEAAPRSTPRTPVSARASAERFIRVVHSQPGPRMIEHCSPLPDRFVPLAGYRGPILEPTGNLWPARARRGEADQATIAATERVARRLAHDGLLRTLAHVIAILGPDRFTKSEAATLDALRSVGLPTDLLSCYSTTNPGPAGVVALIVRRLDDGVPLESIQQELGTLPFRFRPSLRSFQVATESGEDELGTMRVQVGGGYRDGVVTGGSIDVITQLVNAFPAVDFLISVPSEHQKPFHAMAAHSWRLRRTNHVTLVSEPLMVTAWAQDNGKAGWIAAGPVRRLATLVPRYACIGEAPSQFSKGESFLMDGLVGAGHEVVQSPLLFQGGNLLAVRDPKTGERLLLIGEAELYRNTALGLTRAQVLEVFKAEFGVDRCVTMPALSFHLDYDVCLRAHDGGLIAFVNDTPAAARSMVGLGLNALAKGGVLDTSAAQAARAALASGRDFEMVGLLRKVIPAWAPAATGYPSSLSPLFATSQFDSPTDNVQCFLLALDLMESTLAAAGESATGAELEHALYLHALRRMTVARQAQIDVLRRQGWKVVAVPSTGDLYRGINYLNGIHHRQGYILPAFGGFFARLDGEAIAAFRQAIGSEPKITSILTAESQRQHGGVHCTTAAYPRL